MKLLLGCVLAGLLGLAGCQNMPSHYQGGPMKAGQTTLGQPVRLTMADGSKIDVITVGKQEKIGDHTYLNVGTATGSLQLRVEHIAVVEGGDLKTLLNPRSQARSDGRGSENRAGPDRGRGGGPGPQARGGPQGRDGRGGPQDWEGGGRGMGGPGGPGGWGGGWGGRGGMGMGGPGRGGPGMGGPGGPGMMGQRGMGPGGMRGPGSRPSTQKAPEKKPGETKKDEKAETKSSTTAKTEK